MALFNISPLNSLQFVRSDDLLESLRNTAYQDITSLSKMPYCQKLNMGDTVTIQVKTDYTTVTAYFYNILTNTTTALIPVKETTYTGFSFWEIPVGIITTGFYKIFVSGILSGSTPVLWVSEMIEVRSSWEGVKIDYYNTENTPYVDYSNSLRHMMRVGGIIRFSDIGGKEDIYDNLGSKEIINVVNDTIYDLVVENIPYYLCKQLIYASRCDVFKVNDVEYISEEHSLVPHPGSHNFDITLKMTEKEVYGINADDDSHSFMWLPSTSGDDITETASTHTYNTTNTVLEKTLYHPDTTPGIELICTVKIHKDGIVIYNKEVTFLNGTGSVTITVPYPVYPGRTYYIDYAL